MTNKINFLTHFVWSVTRTPKRGLVILLSTLPIFTLIAFFSFLEMNSSNTFFMTIFLLSYYVCVFAITYGFKTTPKHPLARSPFYFIKKLNLVERTPWTMAALPNDHRIKYLIGAEIGVNQGLNAKSILNFLNIEQLVLVDPWAGFIDGCTGLVPEEHVYHEENVYQEVKKAFSNNPKVRIIRDFSVNAAKTFDDEYFDFVYIDADHSYEAVLADLEAWHPKLKKFGVLCGDDFGLANSEGVIEAVTKFAFDYKLPAHFGEDDAQFWFVKV